MSGSDGPWYYEMVRLGFNYRISDLHCALGLAQLNRLDSWLDRRRELVERYRKAFTDDPRIGFVRTSEEEVRPAWHLFTVTVPRRRQIFEYLRSRGIGVQVHYIPVHLQPYYRQLLGTKEGDFPETERYYAGAFSLPLFPTMSDQDADRVIDELRTALDN